MHGAGLCKQWCHGLGQCGQQALQALLVVGLAGEGRVLRQLLGEAVFATFGFNRAYFQESRSSLTVNFANYYLLRNELLPVLLLPLLIITDRMVKEVVAWT